MLRKGEKQKTKNPLRFPRQTPFSKALEKGWG